MSEPTLLPFTETAPERIDRFVARSLSVSRNQVQKWVRQGLVTIDEQVIGKPSFLLREAIEVEVVLPDPTDSELIPEPDYPLDILYQSANWLALSKRSGQVVHPGAGREQGTMSNGMIARYPQLTLAFDGSDRPGVVHRLDLGTSGVLLWALKQSAATQLAEQFASRSMRKYYLAWVDGDIREPRLLDKALYRSSSDRRKFTVQGRGTGRTALTEVVPICHRAEGRQYQTLVMVRIYTGRTHQIRVHCSDAGFPVCGDRVYGRDHRVADINMMLHAWTMVCLDPDTGFERKLQADPDRLALSTEEKEMLVDPETYNWQGKLSG